MRIWSALFFLLALPASLPAAPPVGLLPEDKQATVLVENERNPFGRRGPKTPTKTAEDTESEEARIRGVIGSMAAVGSGGNNGVYSALLGSMVVQPGRDLPPILTGQTEKVRVLRVEAEMIELGFVEKDLTTETRKITIPIRNKPEVRYSLGIKTAPAASEETKTTFGGVMKSSDEKPTNQ